MYKKLLNYKRNTLKKRYISLNYFSPQPFDSIHGAYRMAY